MLVAFFFTLIFRKYDENTDFEYDQDDDEKNLNEFKMLSDFKTVGSAHY